MPFERYVRVDQRSSSHLNVVRTIASTFMHRFKNNIWHRCSPLGVEVQVDRFDCVDGMLVVFDLTAL